MTIASKTQKFFRKLFNRVTINMAPIQDAGISVSSELRLADLDNGITFHLHPAIGGWIMEYPGKFDRRTDVISGKCFYLITSEQDMSERVAHIVTTELLKK
jgi:hypothetical protein